MRRKKIAGRRRRIILPKNRGRALIVTLCLIVTLGAAAVGGPWGASLRRRGIRPLMSAPPPLPPAGSPSKEYIYAGGRLVATEEPNSLTLAPPTNLVASTVSSVQINISWTAAPNAHHYQVERAGISGGPFTVLNSNVPGTTLSDNSAVGVKAYLYRVRAADASGNLSATSNVDLATAIVFEDDPLPDRAKVRSQHILQLRQAVNAVRAAALLPDSVWTDNVASLSGFTIKAIHIQELRTNLDGALSKLGLPASPYTDSSLSGVHIKKIHIDELRQRVK